MLTAIIIICIILAAIFEEKYGEGDGFEIIAFIMGIGELIVLIFLIYGIFVTLKQLEMYQEENAAIEAKIESTVEKYINYEKSIIFEVSPDEAITLVSLYPDLKSDHLIQAEIDTYIANNEKIKDLKADLNALSVNKFLLYFGH